MLVNDLRNGASGFHPSRIWRLVPDLCSCRCRAGTVVVVVARALCLPQPKCDMQKLTVDELKRLLYDTFCEHLSMKDIENIIMTEEESHLGTAEECPVDVESECLTPGTPWVGQLLEQGRNQGFAEGVWSLLACPKPGVPVHSMGIAPCRSAGSS